MKVRLSPSASLFDGSESLSIERLSSTCRPPSSSSPPADGVPGTSPIMSMIKVRYVLIRLGVGQWWGTHWSLRLHFFVCESSTQKGFDLAGLCTACRNVIRLYITWNLHWNHLGCEQPRWRRAWLRSRVKGGTRGQSRRRAPRLRNRMLLPSLRCTSSNTNKFARTTMTSYIGNAFDS